MSCPFQPPLVQNGISAGQYCNRKTKQSAELFSSRLMITDDTKEINLATNQCVAAPTDAWVCIV